MKLFRENLEAIVWAGALAWLALSDPASGAHFTLCPMKILGIEHCPGCGLGRAVSSALHGDLAGSLQYHLLGIPAIVILVARTAVLAKSVWGRYTADTSPYKPTKEHVCQTPCN